MVSILAPAHRRVSFSPVHRLETAEVASAQATSKTQTQAKGRGPQSHCCGEAATGRNDPHLFREKRGPGVTDKCFVSLPSLGITLSSAKWA